MCNVKIKPINKTFEILQEQYTMQVMEIRDMQALTQETTIV